MPVKPRLPCTGCRNQEILIPSIGLRCEVIDSNGNRINTVLVPREELKNRGAGFLLPILTCLGAGGAITLKEIVHIPIR